MHLQRLFEIVYLLLYRKRITAKELAERFEVSTRTIYRDLDTLSAAGIPLYTTKGRDGGIFLMEGFVLNRSLLSEEEQKNILVSLQGVQTLSKLEINSTLDRMRTLFHQEVPNWISIDLSDWSNLRKQMFENIQTAIWNHQALSFTYCSTDGKESKRNIYPLQLWFKDHQWYIKAFCKDKKDYRTFKITRMRHVIMEKEIFSPLPIPEDNTTIEQTTFPSIDKLELAISSSMAYRVYDEFEEHEIQRKDNGDFLITIAYPLDNWVYGKILSFAQHCKVLSPSFVRNEVQKKLRESLELYREENIDDH